MKMLASLGLASLATGCSTVMSLDPVLRPPSQYQHGATVTVEFVAPEYVAIRCLERGVPFLANACTGAGLITMPVPFGFGGFYANVFSHELAHVNGWDTAHRDIRPASESPQALALNQ